MGNRLLNWRFEWEEFAILFLLAYAVVAGYAFEAGSSPIWKRRLWNINVVVVSLFAIGAIHKVLPLGVLSAAVSGVAVAMLLAGWSSCFICQGCGKITSGFVTRKRCDACDPEGDRMEL